MTVKQYDEGAIFEIVRSLLEIQDGRDPAEPVAIWVQEQTGIIDFDRFLKTELEAAANSHAAGIDLSVALRGILTTALLVGFKIGKAQGEAEHEIEVLTELIENGDDK